MSCCCLEPRWFVGDPTPLARDNMFILYIKLILQFYSNSCAAWYYQKFSHRLFKWKGSAAKVLRISRIPFHLTIENFLVLLIILTIAIRNVEYDLMVTSFFFSNLPHETTWDTWDTILHSKKWILDLADILRCSNVQRNYLLASK